MKEWHVYKGISTWCRLCLEKKNPWIVQSTQIWTYLQYMHKPEYVVDYEIHEVVWNLECQMDYSVSAKISDLVLMNKKKMFCERCCSSGL